MNKLGLICILSVALLSSCHPKQVAVEYGDDVYYRETSEKVKNEVEKKMPEEIDKKKMQSSARSLIAEAYSWVGVPYVYGGHSMKGTDCSGYVMEVFKRALDYDLPRSTSDQNEACENVKRDKLLPGDLVFFKHIKHGKINHVGIYVGEGKFLHASTSRGVMESNLEEEYYDRRFRHGGRILGIGK